MQIWNHPDILYQFVAQRKEDNDLDLEDTKPVDGRYGNCNSPTTVLHRGQQRSRLLRSNTTSSLDEMIGAMDVNKKDSVITYDWVGGLVSWLVAFLAYHTVTRYNVVCQSDCLSVCNAVHCWAHS